MYASNILMQEDGSVCHRHQIDPFFLTMELFSEN
jgi:hypothetical protein